MHNATTMDLETVTLPAYWASALVNNDWSGLTAADATELRAWLHANPDCGPMLACSDVPFVGAFSGLITDCLEYFYTLGDGAV